jgi:hypothetical protein
MPANTFLLGCPRSGTTLLAEIINCNSQAAILIERHSILNRKKLLVLSDYEQPRVGNFEEFPCEHPAINSEILKKHDMAAGKLPIYGDKIPKLYENGSFFQSISDPTSVTIIATLRNVFDICLSYNARLKSTTDNWNLKISDGVRDWNTYLNRVNTISRSFNTYFFDYDEASEYFGSIESFVELSSLIYKSLGLPTGAGDIELDKLSKVHKVAKNALPIYNQERQGRRHTPESMKLITIESDFESYRNLVSKEIFYTKTSGQI